MKNIFGMILCITAILFYFQPSAIAGIKGNITDKNGVVCKYFETDSSGNTNQSGGGNRGIAFSCSLKAAKKKANIKKKVRTVSISNTVYPYKCWYLANENPHDTSSYNNNKPNQQKYYGNFAKDAAKKTSLCSDNTLNIKKPFRARMTSRGDWP